MGFALLVVLAAVLAHGVNGAEGKQKKPHLVLHLSSETSDKVVWGRGEDHLGSEMGLISRMGKNTFLQLVLFSNVKETTFYKHTFLQNCVFIFYIITSIFPCLFLFLLLFCCVSIRRPRGSNPTCRCQEVIKGNRTVESVVGDVLGTGMSQEQRRQQVIRLLQVERPKEEWYQILALGIQSPPDNDNGT